MRNWIWSACLAGVAAVSAAAGTSYYAYQNPDSFLGRCAMSTVLLGARNNPLVYGLSAVSPGLTSLEDGVTLTDPAVSDAEEADSPLCLDGLPMTLPNGHYLDNLPQYFPPSPTIPLSEELKRQSSESFDVPTEPPSYHGPVLRLESESTRFMPYCVRDNDCACDSCPLTWFTKTVEHCWMAAQRMTERNWLTCWLGGMSSPTMLPVQGDEEAAESREQKEPEACKEDPNLPYHHSGCPYGSGACPYTGKVPTYTAPLPVKKPAARSEEQSEPPLPTKHKIKWPKLGEDEESEFTPVHPEVDTMEFRKSDRKWDDYGTPSGL